MQGPFIELHIIHRSKVYGNSYGLLLLIKNLRQG